MSKPVSMFSTQCHKVDGSVVERLWCLIFLDEVVGVAFIEKQRTEQLVDLGVSPMLAENISDVVFTGYVVKRNHLRRHGLSHVVVCEGVVSFGQL